MYARIFLISLTALSSLLVSSGSDARPRMRRIRPRPQPALVSVSLESEGGARLRSFHHAGQTFVLGNHGGRYNIRVRNHESARIEVVVSVDGRDVVNGRKSQPRSDRGYVIPAHGSVLIRGFRTSLSSVAAFRFTSPEDSFAGRHGQAHRVGIIDVRAFREKRARPVIVAKPRAKRRELHRNRRSASKAPAPARPSVRGDRARRRPAPRPFPRPDHDHFDRSEQATTNNLGTQFGEQMRSQVRETTFVRARSRPDLRMTLRYDNARGLEARGIEVFRKRRRWRRSPVRPQQPRRPQQPLRQSRFAQPPPARR